MSNAKVTVTDLNKIEPRSFDWGAIKWLVNKELVPNAEQTVGIVWILPGQGNPLHYHPNCEEVLVVLEGECDHSFEGEWVHLTEGMAITIPAGVKHNLVNNGWEPLKCLLSFSSPERETVFLE